MSLWQQPRLLEPSLDPPPLTHRDRVPRERGRLGANSTRLHSAKHYPRRIEEALEEAADHARDRQLRRLVRRSISRLVIDRAAELGTPLCGCEAGRCRHLPALWAGYARRIGSCEYAKVARNSLTGTEVAFPFSCRVPGCPHCEGERVDEHRRRFLPLVEEAVRPRIAFLTIVNPPLGQLGAGWSVIARGAARLWRSPLFNAVEHCRTARQRAQRRHVGTEECTGHRRHCRAGKVGCLAAIAGVDLEQRRECAGRCRRAGDPHPYCRACPGHQPATAALLSLETTANRRERSWHPHANLLFDGGFIDKFLLAAAWAVAVGAPTAHVWIRDVDRDGWTRKRALYEAVKYAIKPDADLIDSSAPAWYVEWVEARRGRRLVRSYGAWHGVAEVDEDEESAAGEETVPVLDDDGRTYRLPTLDPVTDAPAEWILLPGDAPRWRFLRVQPPTTDQRPRRAWLVAHPLLPERLVPP